MTSDFGGEFSSGFDVDTGSDIGTDVTSEGFDTSSFDLSPLDSADVGSDIGSEMEGLSAVFDLEPLDNNSASRGMDFETRFEKEPMAEPELIGEFAPSLPASDIEHWESLQEVPFAGDTSELTEVSDTGWDDLQDIPFGGEDNVDTTDVSE